MTVLAVTWAPALLVPALCLVVAAALVAVLAARDGASPSTVGLVALVSLVLATAVLGGLGVLPPALGDRAGVASVAVAVPLACLWVPDAPPRRLAVVVVPLVVLVGGSAAVTLDARLVGVASLVVPTTVVGGLWWRFERGVERAPGRARDRLRWVALGCALTVFLVIPVAFAGGRGLLVVGASCVVVLVVPVSVVLAYRAPEGVEVRLVAARAAGLLIAVLVALAVFSGVVAGLTLVGVDPTRPGVESLVAAGVAVGFAPVRRLVGRTVDQLLFGDRLDPVQAASLFAEELAAADDPVAVLRALRSVLGVPSASVHDDAGSVLISSGAPEQSGLTYALPLNAAGGSVGALVLGLRPGDTGPSSHDRPVLRIVVPALAQLVRARGLAEALEGSRARVIEAVEEDRDRLRRDLHDGLGPALTGVAYAADAARNLLPRDPDRAAAVLEDLRADTTEAIGEVRRLVDGLRPAVLDDLGLAAALRRHAAQLRSRGGGRMSVTLDLAEPLVGLGATTELAVFRIVTEALTNVARHAGVDHAHVQVALAPDGLEVAVLDDGRPGPAGWTPGGGLRSMRERVDQLGGRFEAGARPDGGLVRVWLPLRPA